MEPNDITLYALSTCLHCRSCKEFLAQCGCNYTCIEVDKLEGAERKAVLEEVKNLNPRVSFPTLVIGDTVIVGFLKEEIQEMLHSR
ncbi:MAG: glutaredoxin family protein [Deltaproteobacteria bacterium]|nr:glutaredoxin family protein [Deltaproteobacteria bacterium]